MFLNFDIKTLDKMSDGVVLIDRYGQVTDFNDAAKPWVKHCMNGAEMLSVLLASVQRKNSRLPLQVDLFGSSDAETVPEAGPVLPEVHLCNDGQDGYALLFTLTRWPTPVVGLVSQGPAQSHLIGDDVRHELSDLIREIATVRANTGVPRLNELRQHAQHLRAMFTSIDELSRLTEVDAMVPGERMSVMDLLQQTISGLTFRHCEYGIQAPGDTQVEPLGLVYGSAKWLLCALQGLIEGLEDGTPRNSRIALTMRQNGGFLVLSARPASEVDGLQHLDATQMATASTVQTGHCAALRLASTVRVPLARRIVEMHGGQLDVQQAELGSAPLRAGITGFTLQLPTGSPANLRSQACENCLVNQQLALYARDLAELMPHVSKENEVSDEERYLLLRIADERV